MTTKDEAERLATRIMQHINLYPEYNTASEVAALLRSQADEIERLKTLVIVRDKIVERYADDESTMRLEIESLRAQVTTQHDVLRRKDREIDEAMKQGATT